MAIKKRIYLTKWTTKIIANTKYVVNPILEAVKELKSGDVSQLFSTSHHYAEASLVSGEPIKNYCMVTVSTDNEIDFALVDHLPGVYKLPSKGFDSPIDTLDSDVQKTVTWLNSNCSANTDKMFATSKKWKEIVYAIAKDIHPAFKNFGSQIYDSEFS